MVTLDLGDHTENIGYYLQDQRHGGDRDEWGKTMLKCQKFLRFKLSFS